MNRLEDLLLPDSLQVKKKSLETLLDEHMEQIAGLDAIIDDGGISVVPLTLDEIQELESRNYPNVRIEELTKDEIEEERFLSELGFKDWVQGIEDEEHYVDHEESPSQENIVSSLIQKSSEILDSEKGSFIEIPDYLLNDPEIVGYPDEEMQNEIYEWVYNKLPKHNFSIKDLGCGRGDFFNQYLNPPSWEFSIPSGIDYFGIDSNPNLIQVGQQKYPGIKLICNDFNDVSIQTDYTICIGTLNDDHGFDKWEYFNKTLNHALNNTKTAILFVLQGNCYGEQGHLDYPIPPLVSELPYRIGWEIDNSRFEDIYLLTVHIGSFN